VPSGFADEVRGWDDGSRLFELTVPYEEVLKFVASGGLN
jgi:hypothetical protein